MIALIDCNSFYCACEAVFRPDLAGKGIVVLSRNDGCVIARNQQAKDAGIPMGAPYFQYQHIIDKHGIQVFASNFALYANFSMRIMRILERYTPQVEVYSIDEAFCYNPSLCNGQDSIAVAQHIRATILKETGITVSVGLAPTKVLAKCANRLAKKMPQSGGVFALTHTGVIDAALKQCAVEDIWGIGSKQAKKCHALHIRSAYQLKYYKNTALLRQRLSVVGMRIQQELQGVSCIQLAHIDDVKKSIRVSRSFKHALKKEADVMGAVSAFIAQATATLRAQKSRCHVITVYLNTDRFKDRYQQACFTLPYAQGTQSPTVLMQWVRPYVVRAIGAQYKQIGVVLSGFTPQQYIQVPLFGQKPQDPRIWNMVDALGKRFGINTVHMATHQQYLKQQVPSLRTSPCYTTKWSDLKVVGI